MEKLTVTVLTKNEEDNIEQCLKSIQWADEILVIDSGSTDKTLEICHQYGCRIIKSDWMGFGPTRQLSVNLASSDWILVIDADEVVTEKLAGRIKQLLSAPDETKAYSFKRDSFYLDKKIRFCWGQDYTLRLFNRKYGNYNDNTVHESVDLKAEVVRYREQILHYTYPTIESHIKKINLYSSLGAIQSYEKGKRSSIVRAVLRGLYFFVEMYFLRLGFLDGKQGLILSIISSYGSSIKYFKIWERQRKTD